MIRNLPVGLQEAFQSAMHTSAINERLQPLNAAFIAPTCALDWVASHPQEFQEWVRKSEEA